MTDKLINMENPRTTIYNPPTVVYGRKPVCCFWTDQHGMFHHLDGGPPQYKDYASSPDVTIDARPPLEYLGETRKYDNLAGICRSILNAQSSKKNLK